MPLVTTGQPIGLTGNPESSNLSSQDATISWIRDEAIVENGENRPKRKNIEKPSKAGHPNGGRVLLQNQ